MSNDETSDQLAARNATVIDGQKRALELAVHGAPLADILTVLVQTIEAQSSTHVLGSILLLDDSGSRLRHGAAPSLAPAYCEAIDGIEIGPTVGSCGTAAFHAKTVVVRDIATDPLWDAFAPLALRHELAACWSMPIFSTQGTVLGTFALYHRTPMEPTDRDKTLVELLGHTAGLIIERERNARARAETEAKLRTAMEQQIARIGVLFEHAPVGIAVVTGTNHTFELANAAYLRLIGGRPVVGKSLDEALPELRGQGFDKLLDGVRATGTPYVGRGQRVLIARGEELEEIFVDFVYEPVRGTNGTVESILVVAFEVTDVVRARDDAEQARLRAETSEQALRAFIDNLPTLAWTAQPDGAIDYYNRRWYEYTGTTFEEMRGWGWQRVHDETALPEVLARWRHSLASGEPFEMEFTLRGKDGVPRWFLTRVVPQHGPDGSIIRWFGTNTDIDDIKAAQRLTDAMAQQSLDVQEALLKLRAAKDRAEHELQQLRARK